MQKLTVLAKWYSRHGFLALKDSERRMILPMKDVPSLLGESSLLVARRGHGRQCAPHWMRADAGHIYGVSMGACFGG